jgi:transcriptional regulator NrdR family protein
MFVKKRDGSYEKFSEKKAFDIFCRSLLNTHMSKKEASKIAKKTLKDLKKELKGRNQITSNILFNKNVKILKKYNEEASFLYKTHRDVS